MTKPNNGGGGSAPCYAGGTHIRTARGEVAVELIQIGDVVVVHRDGRDILEAVKWVGHSSIDLRTHAHVEHAAPIRFRRDSLGDNQPAKDLLVSPEHCMIIDGVCVPAKLLVNGGSIISERNHPPFTYYHLELDRHGILLAENALAESYLDTGNRSLFDNADEPRQLHPRFEVNANSARWITDACAPLAKYPQDIEPIWRRVASRSERIGYPIPSVPGDTDADLHVVADGRIIRPIPDNDARQVFAIPVGVRSVSIGSRFVIPADRMLAHQRDTRRLGVCVRWIAIHADNAETFFNADHPALEIGWHSAERDDKTIWRWTDGNAAIPWDNVTGPAMLTVRCFPAEQYPRYNEFTALVA